jgi:tight adherence protein C
MGAGAWWSATVLLSLLRDDPIAEAGLTSFERDRRGRLRSTSRVYRGLGPAVRGLAAWNELNARWLCRRVGRWLVASGTADWSPAEVLAVAELKSAACAAIAAFPMLRLVSVPSAVVSCTTFSAFSLFVLVRRLKNRADRRTRQVRARLAVAVDLLALALQAGANVVDGLEVVVRVMAGHPLADEFGAVLRDVRRGVPRAQALTALAARFELDVLTDFAATVIQGEIRGTPLVDILKNQAEQMRLRHSQWLEQAAGKASVKLNGPNTVAAVASILLFLAPFLLSASEVIAPIISDFKNAFE